jgi:periplasmic divalent cation tolerance protein
MVTTTTASMAEATQLVQIALKTRMAACAHIDTIQSQYWWESQITNAEEYRITFKTRNSLAGKLMETLRNNHSYKVPCLIETPIIGGAPSYLDWIDAETQS